MMRFEKRSREQTIELNDKPIRLFERFSSELREHQIEVHYTGELMAIGTSSSAIKGVGKVHPQIMLDSYSRQARGRFYTRSCW